VDILILNIHWGPNWVERKNMNCYTYYRDLFFSYGVDIIHGHNTNHILPIYQHSISKKICIYGNGDFIDDYTIDKKYHNDLQMIVNIEIETMNINIYKRVIKDMTVDLMD